MAGRGQVLAGHKEKAHVSWVPKSLSPQLPSPWPKDGVSRLIQILGAGTLHLPQGQFSLPVNGQIVFARLKGCPPTAWSP